MITEKPILMSTPIDRLKSKVVIDDNGCWNFTGSINEKGYGRFSLNDKIGLAHTASYILFKGEITKGNTVDHLCRNRKCVSPDHLESVPHEINLLRGNSITTMQVNQTHCKNGHLFDERNTISRNGHRRCRICDLKWRKNNYENKKRKAHTI